MAKKRKVTAKGSRDPAASPLPSALPSPLPSAIGDHRGVDPLAIAPGALAGTIVYVFYHPSDSVAVEKGDALWFCFLAIVIATITIGGSLLGNAVSQFWIPLQRSMGPRPVVTHAQANTGQGPMLRAGRETLGGNASPRCLDGASTEVTSSTAILSSRRLSEIVLCAAPWLLAGWMMLAAFGSSPPGNLRLATNEAWLWVAAAATFTAARRLLVDLNRRRAMVLVMTVGICGLAVHGLHQQFISLPQTRAEYRSDPDKMLAAAGFDAPEGSAERMMFENRLFDGGPAATFALANSLAAVLIVAAIWSLGVLRRRWSALSATARVAWGSALVLCVACLLATRSRSATLALLVGVVFIFVAGSRVRRTRSRQAIVGLAVVLAVGIVAAAGLAILGNPQWGNPEWLEAAPASLAFRFQYWRSTMAMVLDRPLMGAGPGNFQSIYERYREPSATEQIAEPHNFLFETWASGGLVALAILVCLILAGVAVIWKRGQDYRRGSSAEPQGGPTQMWRVGGVGAFLIDLQRLILRLPSLCGLGNHPPFRRVEPKRGEVSDAPPSPRLGSTLPEGECDDSGSGETQWVVLGAGLGLAMVWLIGLATRQTPDIDANVFAVPVSLLLAALLWPSMRRLPSDDFDFLGSVALAVLMIHLLVSGGWTVPGVAIVAWLLFAALTRPASGESATGKSDRSGNHPPSRRVEPQRGEVSGDRPSPRLGSTLPGGECRTTSQHNRLRVVRFPGRRVAGVLVIVAGVLAAGSIYWLSIRPVEAGSRAMSQAAYYQSRGQIGRAKAALERAVEADGWSSDAVIWLADFHRWQLILDRDTPAVRNDWQAAIALAKQRSGDDPAIYRMLGAQQIHLFQRYGEPQDLAAAAETFTKATSWSPASEWFAAQSAAIAAARGQQQEASQLAAQAYNLSLLGGNIERSLDRQQIYEVSNLGPAVRQGAIRRPASELLANQIGAGDVTRQ